MLVRAKRAKEALKNRRCVELQFIDAIESMISMMPRTSRQKVANNQPRHTDEHRHVLAEWSRQINFQAYIPSAWTSIARRLLDSLSSPPYSG